MTILIVSGLAIDHDCVSGKNGGSVKEGTMVLAAVKTMAQADAIRLA
tara:strand:+ start:955 stop:1095 length:141 start_codon:yes stop_codon:yes gene_type:complete